MAMNTLLVALVAGLLQPPTAVFERLTFRAPDGTTVRYGLALPTGFSPREAHPLILALHPGGDRPPYYGDQFMRGLFYPGLRALDPIMIAPDCPTPAWSDPGAEHAVLALVEDVISRYGVDRRRVMVMGFSLGGSGTWFLSSRHADLFSAAIVVAGRTDEPLDRLATRPTFVIHSQDDRVVPFPQAAERVAALKRLGRAVEFEALSGPGHFEMGAYMGALQRAGQWVAEQWKR